MLGTWPRGPVDGERIAFRSTISNALGETTVEVEQARFGIPIEDAAFAPAQVKR